MILVVPEAAWLLYEHRRSRPVGLATAAVALVGVALLPLLLAQDRTHNNLWIAQSSYLRRLAQVLPMAVVGPETHLRVLLKLLGFAMIAVGVVLLVWRSSRGERRAALLPGGHRAGRPDPQPPGPATTPYWPATCCRSGCPQ